MNDSVSKWVYAMLLTASLLVMSQILVANLGWSGLLWLGVVGSVAFELLRRTSTRSMVSLLWEDHPRPRGEVATLAQVAIPVPSRPRTR
jgi:hypothetical protein